jgi:hypothetical protein
MKRGFPSQLKDVARRALGPGCYEAIRRNYSFWISRSDFRYIASNRRIRALWNKHRGKRCFIIGNGPSLKKTDLSLLKGEITFGMNRIYLLFRELGFSTTYFVSVNRLVIEQCAEEIVQIPCPKFIRWRARDSIEFTRDMMFVRSRKEPGFSTDLTRGVWGGATVTYVTIQIAYYLGFQKVIIVGVDHSFETKGVPGATVVSEGDDPNHFDSQYFGKGFRWQLPDLETSELAYRLAKYQFEGSNREIVDATIDGKLQVFRKVDYLSLF